MPFKIFWYNSYITINNIICILLTQYAMPSFPFRITVAQFTVADFTYPTKKWLPNFPVAQFSVAQFTIYLFKQYYICDRLKTELFARSYPDSSGRVWLSI